MGKITLLDQNTINKIAAGEVIERPAAVVKELVENAIDAGANAITVEIKDGGISFIRITDNGSGINNEDIKTAFLRHATSKIRSVEDLLCVSSLGFRGEALSSIASVAMVELITKTPSSLLGTRYCIEGGIEKSLDEIGCPDGTTFIVRNLFFNTPARRKFLKTATTEGGYIYDLIERLAVSHPNISFKLLSNNQLKLNTSGNNKLKDILYHVYGRDITMNLTEISAEIGDVKVKGYIGKPIITRGNRNYENYFINGRYIKSPVIMKAIEEAYRPYIMLHRYPFTALHFTIHSDLIDVNVHPTKMEIRFRNSEEIFQLTKKAIEDVLSEKELIPEVTLTEEKKPAYKPVMKQADKGPEPFESKRMKEEEKEVAHKPSFLQHKEIEKPDEKLVRASNEALKTIHDTIFTKDESEKPQPQLLSHEKVEMKEEEPVSVVQITPQIETRESMVKEADNYQAKVTIEESVEEPVVEPVKADTKPAQMNLFEERLLSKEAVKEHRIIGQLFATYWIIEYKDKMFMIDQHAAHEKVLYERTLKALAEKKQNSQMLLPPIVLTLGPREQEVLEKHKEQLNQLGFEVEPFGGKEFSIRAVPTDMFGVATKEILIEFIDSLVDDIGETNPEIILEKAASMSCKAAVKGNQKLSEPEARALIDELMTLDNPYNCPHGRPVIISMSKYEIEKKFKRIV
ncbi:DNA mismatch repair protein MutL [Lachnospiraceae bacterium KM106-2]|nr:DNA mismatch repair protein MutL [Lachnospiraceae bacterium KM106-2]